MQYQVLLLEDISLDARKGQIIKVKPGFARNYLLPQQKAVIVDRRTLRMQQQLQEERAKQAEQDKKHSEKLAKEISGKEYKTKVKVDPDGNMYGSVTASEISKILKENGFEVNKRYVNLPQPIRKLGDHTVELVLKEGVEVSFKLSIESEIPLSKREAAPKEKEEKKTEEQAPAVEEKTEE